MKPKLKDTLNKIVKFIKPILRGTIKALPFGTPIIETIDNIKSEIKISKGEIPKRVQLNGSMDKPLAPHNWTSVIINLMFVTIIVYAFVTKTITVSEVLNYIRIFLSFTSSQTVINEHSINLDTLNN